MSPNKYLTLSSQVRFPRVSGDEPALNTTAPADRKFSPRERG